MLLADTLVHETPTSAQLADIAIQAAAKAHQLGLVPRVALLSYSNFGNPRGQDGQRVRDAAALLDERGVGFEYDGEMSADVALDERWMRQLYPFCRLRGPANILVMPELHSANIAAKLLPPLGGGTVVGPLLLGLSQPVQIVNMGATVSTWSTSPHSRRTTRSADLGSGLAGGAAADVHRAPGLQSEPDPGARGAGGNARACRARGAGRGAAASPHGRR